MSYKSTKIRAFTPKNKVTLNTSKNKNSKDLNKSKRDSCSSPKTTLRIKKEIEKQRRYKQAPITIISEKGKERKVIRNISAEWYIKSKPRRKDNWVEFAKRYGKKDEEDTKWRNYKDYCRSSKFKKWKRKVLELSNYICSKCGSSAQVAHHLKYRKWGTEIVEDGQALCNKCHWKIHSK